MKIKREHFNSFAAGILVVFIVFQIGAVMLFFGGGSGDSNQLTGESVTSIARIEILQEANNITDIFRNRVFYEDGVPVNLTVFTNGHVDFFHANLSCLDVNYEPGDENTTKINDTLYYVTYFILNNNTRLNVNNSEDSTCPVGTECHRVCDVLVNSSGGANATIQLPLYNGLDTLSNAWSSVYVTRAADCGGAIASFYFLENNTCPSVAYNSGTGGYDVSTPDTLFAVTKKNSPTAVEKICTNSISDQDSPVGPADCEDFDCASIVYGEYFVAGGSNPNKVPRSEYSDHCNRTKTGWRDDPPYDPGDLDATIVCDYTQNVCRGNEGDGATGTTYVNYTYAIRPDHNFSIQLVQSDQNGKTFFALLTQFNQTLQSLAGPEYFEFSVINRSASTGVNNESLATSQISTRVQSGPQDPIAFTNTELDIVMKIRINDSSTPFRGIHGIRYNRIVNAVSSFFKLNFNVSDDGMRDESDISCADDTDNDLDYQLDCGDVNCDGSIDNGADKICAFGNESKYAATNNSCMDFFDNDRDGPLDCDYDATRDTDCNSTFIINASVDPYNNGSEQGLCTFFTEYNCSDGFDNDRDRAFDCNVKEVETGEDYTTFIEYRSAAGTTNPLCIVSNDDSANIDLHPDAEYNCSSFCRDLSPQNRTENGTLCLNGKDDDLDFFNFGTCTQNTTGGGFDCRMVEYDLDCNGTVISGGNFCELEFERSCSDGFDNDRDGEYDCVSTSTGGPATNPTFQYGQGGSNTATGEYDCQTTCNVTANFENNVSECFDNIDNDLDYFTITGYDGEQYTATNNEYGGGMDCRFNFDGNHYPDEDCNNVTNGTFTCNLGHEINCTDGVDNDVDAAYNDGGNRTSQGGFDCDDYDCVFDPACATPQEQGADCYLDGTDDDLDKFVHNNTDYLLDSNRVLNLSGGIDCIYNDGIIKPSTSSNTMGLAVQYDGYLADPSCNNTALTGGFLCELLVEQNCTDGFDNDQDYYVSNFVANTGGDIFTANWTLNPNGYLEHFGNGAANSSDCDDYSCFGNSACPSNESLSKCTYGECNQSRNWCLDGVDNDLDDYLSNGTVRNTSDLAGVDCVWDNYDADCNNTLINDTATGAVGFCTLRQEGNCSDNVDNDQDLGIFYLGEEGSKSACKNAGFCDVNGTDCSDYDCFNNSACPSNETICDDYIDNDLDQFTFNGTVYINVSGTGTDCADPDCDNKPGPGGVLCALTEEMKDDPFNDSLCGDHNSTGDTAFALDNDGDDLANCYDDGCYLQGLCRVCPAFENITIDSCKDRLDNEFTYQDENISNISYNPAQINASLTSDGVDCLDTDCDGRIGQYQGSPGICNSSSSGTGYRITEDNCGDGIDNDLDNNLDCEDSDCTGSSACPADLTNTIGSCNSATTNCTDEGNINALTQTLPFISNNIDWGSKTTDVHYTNYQYAGKNITIRWNNTAANAVDNKIKFFIGSASETFIPSALNVTNETSGIFGIEAENFSINYFNNTGGAEIDTIVIEYQDSALPYINEVLNLTFFHTVPNTTLAVNNSSYIFYVSDILNPDETEGADDVHIRIIENELPAPPIFVKTPSNFSVNLIRTDDKVIRTGSTAKLELRVNATDSKTGNFFDSGIEFCQFHNGTGDWQTETSAYDCRFNISVDNGTTTVYARAIDGVGNVGPNTSITIEVITIPIQSSDFSCSSGDCTDAYPDRDYFTNDQEFNVEVNFTSEVVGFTDNATGCTVYAENNTNGAMLLGSVNLSSVGNVGVCNGTVPLSTLVDGYYTIRVEAYDDSGEKLISGRDPWDPSNFGKENIFLCPYIKTFSGYTCKTLCDGTAPTTPVLLVPTNDSNITNRTPTFYWNNSVDADGDTITYIIEIDDSPTFTSPHAQVSDIFHALSFTNSSFNLTVPLSVDTTYYWRVRATDGALFSPFSDVFQFNISSFLALNFDINDVDFGILAPGDNNNTEDYNPPPLTLSNAGNVEVNATLYATNMFNTSYNPSPAYQFKVQINESNAFISLNSTTNFTNFTNATAGTDVFNFNWTFTNNTVEVHINVTVPEDETPGERQSNVTAEAVL